MTISWKQKSNPNLITEQIQNSKIVGDNNTVQFEAFNFNVFKILLYNILDFPPDISEIDARQMIYQGIMNSANKREITPKNILTELNLLEQKFLSLPFQRYVLITSISISRFIKINKIYLHNDIIIFENNLSEPYINDKTKELLKRASSWLFSDLPKDYSNVRIHVSSRSIYNAANQALENVDFIRGIWNWVLNRSTTYRKTYGGMQSPINRIILGPIHTLHRINGDFITPNEWWYEPSYLGAIKTYNPTQDDMNKLYQSQFIIRKKINKLQYLNDIKSAFIRYAKALDERDLTSSYIKLWGILEFLTNTNNGPSHDITVKRASSIYKEREFHFQVLRILKNYRNSYVHSAEETSEIETYLFRLKNYVDSLFTFHINNTFHFESIEKAAEFLDLPVDKKEFKFKLKLYNFAKSFRHY